MPFRQAVRNALARYSQQLEAMEDFPAGDERPLVECRRRLRKADLYVGIVAWHYGHTPDEKNVGGKSITELEYWTAIEYGIECLFFLVEEDVEWKPAFIDHDDAWRRLNAFKAHVLANHSAAYFHSPDHLATQVIAAVRGWEERNQLASELARNLNLHANGTISVVSEDPDTSRSVTRTAAQYLWSELHRRHEKQHTEVSIGIVGGPTMRKIVESVQEIASNHHTEIPSLRFISLNAAGESRSYQHSANFQVTRLSELLHSSHLAATSSPSEDDLRGYESAVGAIDILLCSCGETDGFLVEWLNKKSLANANAGKRGSLPTSVVGDFCLTPIDADGNCVNLPEPLARYFSELRARPFFNSLSDLCRPHRTVIFPITTHPRTFTSDAHALGQSTRKYDAVRAVLGSGVVDRCILGESTARVLLANEPRVRRTVKPMTKLCGFTIQGQLGRDAIGAVYWAESNDGKERKLRIIESSVRREEHRNEYGLPLQPDVEIIVSDPPCPAPLDDKSKRTFPLYVNNDLTWVSLAPRVRKPGFWAATAIRIATGVLGTDNTEQHFNILDLGCGSGIIGIFVAMSRRPYRVVFSDIDSAAVNCASHNAKKMKLQNYEKRVGDMFDAIAPPEKFDFIVFGAPFFPRLSGIQMERTDVAGKRGNELGVRFVGEVSQFLSDRGYALTYLADYIDATPLTSAASAAGLKYEVIEKYILYPFEPRFHFPQAHEIVYRREIESTCGYRFEEDIWDGRRFLRFKMVYFLLSKKRIASGMPSHT
jgi:DNA-binding transcriptional regulator LsrR (DeoR family)/SAM-dependent methyltransferase